MSRGLVQEFGEEPDDQDMFDFVLQEEEDKYMFESGVSVAGKDDDSVKLFIGQIPKEMDEDSLRPYFAEYGPIFELTIIRDKSTKIHRGCAFLTYCHKFSAIHAVEQLHDKIKLPNAVNPLQVRPAESQAERENKLFVGMLPKTITEEDLHGIFSIYGDLREVHIIRGTDGHSKGCAFIKFTDRESALVAIDCMHDSTPEGSSRPLVVKFADTKKIMKGSGGKHGGSGSGLSPPQTPPGHGSRGGGGGMSVLVPGMMSPAGQGMAPEYWSMQQAQAQQSHDGSGGGGGGGGGQYGYSSNQSGQVGVGVSPQQQQQQMMSMPYIAAYPGPSGNPSYVYYQSPVSVYPPSYGAPNTPGGGGAGGGGGGGYPSTNGTGDLQRIGSPHNNNMQMQGGYRTQQQQQHHIMNPSSSEMMSPRSSHVSAQTQVQSHSNSRPPEGPSGANLFIYHLPRDLTDADLATLFASFGNVISAKVYVDKKTAESKGFGFVSYDSVSSAEEAISTMNGFQIGSKRLKVQHKRSGGAGFDMSMGGGGMPMGMGMGMGTMNMGGGGQGGGGGPDHRSSGGQYQTMSPSQSQSMMSMNMNMNASPQSMSMSMPYSMMTTAMGDYGGSGGYGLPPGVYSDNKVSSTGTYNAGPNQGQGQGGPRGGGGSGQHTQSQSQIGLEDQFMNIKSGTNWQFAVAFDDIRDYADVGQEDHEALFQSKIDDCFLMTSFGFRLDQIETDELKAILVGPFINFNDFAQKAKNEDGEFEDGNAQASIPASGDVEGHCNTPWSLPTLAGGGCEFDCVNFANSQKKEFTCRYQIVGHVNTKTVCRLLVYGLRTLLCCPQLPSLTFLFLCVPFGFKCCFLGLQLGHLVIIHQMIDCLRLYRYIKTSTYIVALLSFLSVILQNMGLHPLVRRRPGSMTGSSIGSSNDWAMTGSSIVLCPMVLCSNFGYKKYNQVLEYSFSHFSAIVTPSVVFSLWSRHCSEIKKRLTSVFEVAPAFKKFLTSLNSVYHQKDRLYRCYKGHAKEAEE
eukprot:gene2639-5177_t